MTSRMSQAAWWFIVLLAVLGSSVQGRAQFKVLDVTSVAPDNGVLHECYVQILDGNTMANYYSITEDCLQYRNGAEIPDALFNNSTGNIYGHSDNTWQPADIYQNQTNGYLNMFNQNGSFYDPMGYNGSVLCGPSIPGFVGYPPTQYEWCPNGSDGYYTSQSIIRSSLTPPLTMPVIPSITPGSANVGAGQTAQFHAFSQDSSGHNTSAPAQVTWSLGSLSNAGGQISASGLYTAPATYRSGAADLVVATGALCPFCQTASVATAGVEIIPGTPNITGFTVSGGLASGIQATSSTQNVNITLTGKNFGTTAPAISIAAGGSGLTINASSITVPTGPPTAQSVTFQVQVANTTPTSSVDFQLTTTSYASLNTSGLSPFIPTTAVAPIAPIILDLLAADNNNVCSGSNIGQGAASAQQIVVGQLVAFTACIPDPSIAGFGVPFIASAGWTVPEVFSNNAVGNYVLSTPVTNPNAALGNPIVFQNAGVAMVNPSPACTGSTSFCDFQPFYFIAPGTYDIKFSYQLNNGTNLQSATVEYIVTAPTNDPSCVMSGQSCAFLSAGNPDLQKIQIFAPGQNGNTSTNSVLDSGDPNVPFASALDLRVSATTPAATPGAFRWVQLTSRNTQFMGAQTINCSNCVQLLGLDNVYPYAVNSPLLPVEVFDNPSMNLAFQVNNQNIALAQVNDNFQAQMYLLWDPELNSDGTSAAGCSSSTLYNIDRISVNSKPSTCTGSIPIPIGSLTWGYCGTAINTLAPQPGTWILSCPANGTPDVTPVYIPASGPASYPTWSSINFNTN
jgi:hypothetical protein